MVNLLPDRIGLQHITTLAFQLTSADDCRRAEQILRDAPRLTALSITANPLGLPASEPECNRFVELLLDEWLCSKDTNKLKLRKAYIKNFTFGQCEALLMMAISPTALQELTLSGCYETHLLVESLTRAGISLKSFTNVKAVDKKARHGLLQAYLVSYKGLESLRLECHQDANIRADCDWSGVRVHVETLRSLFVDDFKSQRIPYHSKPRDRSLASLRTLLASCPHLQQLAIRAPAYEPQFWGQPEGFRVFLASRKGETQ